MEGCTAPIGGAFLIEESALEQVLTAEELPAETRLMAKTMEDFLRKEVQPLTERLEAHEEGLMRSLVQKAGALGLLAAGVPELYGGLDLPKSALTLIFEKAAPNTSFAITIGVHTGIALLPLLYFGTPEQKQKYLPKMATGEIIGAFALSEANSGSDALAAQAKATLAPDGKHYLLNGTKMWITNAGFADLFTVLAKVDGDKFTAFLVERDFPGVSFGKEEHKLGIRGSSTRRVILENAQVPVENILGEIGQGHRPALYCLNIGRFNIGASALGSSKELLKIAAQYAKQRVQFGQPIAHFGLIQHKLAEMAIRSFALESMVYRTAGYLDARFGPIDATAPDAGERYRAAAEEYAVECALIKFFGTEVLAYVVDEGLQIHGGFGYTEEFPMARAYRDARISRIYEGTNEINRLTVLDQLLRRAKQGRLALHQAIANLTLIRRTQQAAPLPAFAEKGETESDANRVSPESPSEPLEVLVATVRQIRNAILYVIGQAHAALGDQLRERQEILATVADMTAALYALESMTLRCRKQGVGCRVSGVGEQKTEGEKGRKGEVEIQNPKSKIQNPKSPHPSLAATQVFAHDATAQVLQGARTVLTDLCDEKTLPTHLEALDGLLQPPLFPTIALRRQMAAAVLESEGYPW